MPQNNPKEAVLDDFRAILEEFFLQSGKDLLKKHLSIDLEAELWGKYITKEDFIAIFNQFWKENYE